MASEISVDLKIPVKFFFVEYELGLMTRLNKDRRDNGYSGDIKPDPHMTIKAREHSLWMADTGYYQHSSFPWAENIFYGPTSTESAHIGWVNSSAHHANMLNAGNYAGFGQAVNLSGAHYWTGVFK